MSTTIVEEEEEEKEIEVIHLIVSNERDESGRAEYPLSLSLYVWG